MKYSFDECWEAVKSSEEFQEAVQKLYCLAIKVNPNMTAKEWQFLKCYCTAVAMIEANIMAEANE